MRFGTRTTWAMGGAAAALTFAGYSLGSQADDGVATGKGSSAGQNVKLEAHGPGGPGLQDLADRLGVDRQKLEDALHDIRPDQQRPGDDPKEHFVAGLADKLGIDRAKVEEVLKAQRPKRPEHGREKRVDITAALAKELGVSEAKVRSAFEAVKPGPGGPPHGPDEFLTSVSKELGVSKEKLQAALEKVKPRGAGERHGVRVSGPPIADLAKALGVSESKLEAAIQELKKEQEPEREKRRDEFAQQLADRLGIDVAKVKAALPEPPRPAFKGRP